MMISFQGPIGSAVTICASEVPPGIHLQGSSGAERNQGTVYKIPVEKAVLDHAQPHLPAAGAYRQMPHENRV